MSTPMQMSVFLPNYMLQFVCDGSDPPKIDTELFTSQASCSQLLDIILAFYPQFQFDEKVKEDCQLLVKTFCSMISAQLTNNVLIPLDVKPQHSYFKASFRSPIFSNQEIQKIIKSEADIDNTRIIRFSCSATHYLRSGQFQLAAKNLEEFTQTYKYLNKDEISEIYATEDEAQDTLHSYVASLREAHDQAIAAITLQLCDTNPLANHSPGLEVQLRTAVITLEARQKMFNRAIEDVGFIPALAEYHEAKRKLYTGSSPDTPVTSERGSPLKDEVTDQSTN